MTIETSNMACREILDMMDSEHGGSSIGSDSQHQRRRQPSSSSAAPPSRGWSNSGSFTRRWSPSNISAGSARDHDEEAGPAKAGDSTLVTADERRKRRRRAVARRVARAALGILVVAALSISAVLLLTGEGSGIRRTTKDLLDSVLGSSYPEDEGVVAVAGAAAEEGARRAVETGPRGFVDPAHRPDLPDDRMMGLKVGGDGREARAVSMLGAKLRRAEEAAAMAADGDMGRGMMMTANTAGSSDPLAMAREAERQENRIVTLNGVRVSLHDLVRYHEGQLDEGTTGL